MVDICSHRRRIGGNIYKVKLIKNPSIIGYAMEYCKEMKIPFTAVSELIFEDKNPHGTDRIYLIGSDSIPRIVSILRETKNGFYVIAGAYNDGKPYFVSKRYFSRKSENRFLDEQFKNLFSECFRRWDELFKGE